MEIIATNALISINETFVVQLVSFLVFLFILNRIMIRPLRDVMQQRQDRVADIQQEMTDARTQLEENVRLLREKEAEVLKTANDFRLPLEEDGNQQARQILAAARSEVEGMRRTADTEISSLISEARKALEAESETVATRMMEKVLDRRLTS